jgi:transposase-like protein
VKQYSIHGDDAFPGKGNLRPADAEQKALEKENKELKEEKRNVITCPDKLGHSNFK